MFKKLASAVVASTLVFSAAHANAALDSYLTVKGQRQGVIDGGVTQKGRENSIRVVAVSHEIDSPRDARSGLPTGQRQHKPLVVTVDVDRALPKLYTMLVTNETGDVVLKFWQPSVDAKQGVGGETQIYTVHLTNASIASIEFVQPDTTKPETAKLPLQAKIAFAYQKIEWTWTQGGITGADSWIK